MERTREDQRVRLAAVGPELPARSDELNSNHLAGLVPELRSPVRVDSRAAVRAHRHRPGHSEVREGRQILRSPTRLLQVCVDSCVRCAPLDRNGPLGVVKIEHRLRNRGVGGSCVTCVCF